MKKLIYTLALLLLAGCAFAAGEPPTLLIYNSDLSSGAREADSRLAAKTIRYYADKSNMFSTLIFNPEHPVVVLALNRGRLTADDVAASAPVTSKIKVAKELKYDYVAVSEVSRSAGKLNISFSLYNLKNDKVYSESASAAIDEESDQPAGNSLHTACSGIISKIVNAALGVNADFSEQSETVLTGEDGGQAVTVDTPASDLSELDLKALDKLYAAAMKEKDYSEAYRVIRKSIDLDPNDPELRLKLAEIYYEKQLYKDALECYYSAINMGYRGNDIGELKTKYESRVRFDPGTGDVDREEPPAITIRKPETGQKSAASALLAEADKLWLAGNTEEAIQKYNSVILSYPSDWRPYERLVYLYANSQRYVEAASILKTMNARGAEGGYYDILKRSRTMNALISAALSRYVSEIKSFGYQITKTEPGKASVQEKLKAFKNKTDNLLLVISQLSLMDSGTNFGNLKLICNLLNSAASGYGDFYESRDEESLSAAEDFAEQAENRLKANV
ncbi:MAG: tetratricopeptide repeat protein [Abditibacteriota bacterium]|nr:tetratricopeptide repeat protein [Abditibacteriota bacterium]